MRILRVSFRNLNSLAGTWAVDFQNPEYELNGLFLITGPTGAGKTTLLDAIALALYGETPRVRVGMKENEIMTTGTSESWAEVLFETGAGRFIARWQQKRKANGEYNQARREFARADGSIVTSKVREVDEAVKKYAGLDFSQFTRAVMLAQGAFSAFLRAKDEEKSAILEKITDTSVYTDLSRLAHQREKLESDKCDELEREIQALPLLETDAEQFKQAEIARLTAELQELEKAAQVCQRNIAWLEQLEKSRQDAAALEAEKKLFAQKMADFEPVRLELEKAKAAAVFEPEYTALEKARQDRDRAAEELKRLVAEQTSLSKVAANCTEKAILARKEYIEASEAMEKARPELEAARRKDSQIKEKSEELGRLEKACLEHAERLKRNEAEIATGVKKQTGANELLAQLEKWFASHAADEFLLENGELLKEKLKIQKTQWQQIGDVEKDGAARENEIRELAEARQAEEKGLQQLRLQISECGAVLEDLRRHQEEILGGRQIGDLRESLRDRRLAQTAAEVIRSLDEHRSHLEDGKACPLCGSLEHPFAAGRLPDADTIAIQCHELEKRIREAEELSARIEEKRREAEKKSHEVDMKNSGLKNIDEKAASVAVARDEAARRAADLRRLALENDSEIQAALAPLGFDRQESGGVAAAIDARIRAWRSQVEKREEAGRSMAALAVELGALNADRNNLEREESEKNALLVSAREAIEALRAARQGLLEGREADAEEAALKRAREETEEKATSLENEMKMAQEALDRVNGGARVIQQQYDDAKPQVEAAERDFLAGLIQTGWDEQEFVAARKPAARIEELQRRERELAAGRTRLLTREEEIRRRLEEETALALTDKSLPVLQAEVGVIASRQNTAHADLAACRQELRQNEENREKVRALQQQLKEQRKEWQRWHELDALIGSADGKKFRAFAQNITLDILLAHANTQMAKITDRYYLQRREDRNVSERRERFLDIAVVDNYQAGEVRSIENLSGGESFIASLALALGLSEMAGRETALGSLFLDEGFGTLDSETLETAIDAIASLRSEGKLIGIISHVDALKERILTQISVTQQEKGRSGISGPGCLRLN